MNELIAPVLDRLAPGFNSGPMVPEQARRDAARKRTAEVREAKAGKLSSWVGYPDGDTRARVASEITDQIRAAATQQVATAEPRDAGQLRAILTACRGTERPSEVYKRLAEQVEGGRACLDLLTEIHCAVLAARVAP